MTTVRAASSATPSVASEAAVVVRRGVAHRVAVVREAPPRATRAVVAVAPAAMTMVITIHRVAVVEAAEDDVLWDTLRVEIYQKS